MEEVWKDIPGFEGYYQISNLGNVRSLHYRKSDNIRNLKLYQASNGYIYVNIKKDKKQHVIRVHRLVAKAFCDNPDNKPYVNHINNIRSDNNAMNLEWCTQQENLQYAVKQKRLTNKSSLKVMEEKGWVNLIHARENLAKAGYPNGEAAAKKLRKPIAAYDSDGNEIYRYSSIIEARKAGFSDNLICDCCKGKRKTYKKLTWKYL